MTIADTQSIWDTTLDATRFGDIGVRIAEILNFWVSGDASTNIADTTVTPILEQISEEGLIRLIAAAKESAVTNPWDFVQANVSSVMSQLLQENEFILKRISTKLYGGMELVSRSLPRTTDSNVIP
jgi:hypothetical protein